MCMLLSGGHDQHVLLHKPHSYASVVILESHRIHSIFITNLYVLMMMIQEVPTSNVGILKIQRISKIL